MLLLRIRIEGCNNPWLGLRMDLPLFKIQREGSAIIVESSFTGGYSVAGSFNGEGCGSSNEGFATIPFVGFSPFSSSRAWKLPVLLIRFAVAMLAAQLKAILIHHPPDQSIGSTLDGANSSLKIVSTHRSLAPVSCYMNTPAPRVDGLSSNFHRLSVAKQSAFANLFIRPTCTEISISV